ncbi:hypothetical protein M427DRAFT_30187 [Gonapodya prolifera JEL478]|uniref:Uncharacterized protein n=1 Tax=Gonapodya prolifera (strain JEL478) TaxID=1344416 RepID=A0A139ALP3_GONPJ|nr:hypothetical protein M427DRAFT_30187 [Gonapodya prolifera JEL478]|eukprot:KXS17707.1 hypothetical protein M427DRAFT_30187 [Gonapodya prolifera JEL478]
MRVSSRGAVGVAGALFLLLCASLAEAAANDPVDVYSADGNAGSRTCTGFGVGDRTWPGGMFGYSVALTNGLQNTTYLAVGKPWDSTVHIYSTPTPARTNASTVFFAWCPNVPSAATGQLAAVTCLANATTPDAVAGLTPSTYYTNCTVPYTTTAIPICVPVDTVASQTTSLPSNVTWSPFASLADPLVASTVWSSRLWNNSFSSFEWSLFGMSLAWSTDSSLLAVGIPGRGYQADSSSFKFTVGSVKLYRVGSGTVTNLTSNELDITDAGIIQRPWDKFGSKVLFSTDANSTFLFVAVNGGTDGYQCNTNNVQLCDQAWNSNRVPSDVVRSGVYVFQRNSTAPKGFSFKQILALASPVSLGTLGVDFTVLGSDLPSLTVAMRDYVVTDPTWMSPAGVVKVFRYNTTTGQFALYNSSDSIAAANLSSTATYKQEDYFGKGLAMARDPSTGRVTLNIAAPRESLRVYSLYRAPGDATWNTTVPVRKHYQRDHSFFGANLAMTPDSRFLVVTDPVNDASGSGEAHIYYKGVKPTVGDEMLAGSFGNVSSGTASSAYGFSFTRIGALRKSASTPPSASYRPDHFGIGLSVNWWSIVVGAPVEECVYTYTVPQTYINPPAAPYIPPADTTISNTTLNITIPIIQNNNTFPNVTNTTTVDPNKPVYTTNNALVYGIIAGIAGIVLIVPTLLYVLISSHKKRVLERLKKENPMNETPPHPSGGASATNLLNQGYSSNPSGGSGPNAWGEEVGPSSYLH